MEDKIFDIITDLIRDDISKEQAIDKLLILHSVVVQKGTLCPDVMDLNIDSEISYCDKCGRYHN